jgi:PAS domain S-box-containing protein
MVPTGSHSGHRPSTASRKELEETLRSMAEAESMLSELAAAFFVGGDATPQQLTWPDATGARPPGAAGPEERLRVAEQRFRTLIEQIPAVVFMAVLGEGKNEIYVSPHIEALLGYSQKEWLEDPFLWYSSLHPDDRALWNDEFARGCRHGGPFRAECRFVARDGHVVWVHGEARLIKDDLGRPALLQGVAFDITENKRAAAVLLEQAVTAAQEAEELAIAQRVQTSILPRKLVVPGLEISAKMMPASEVGGDYYDVLPVDDGCWIAIGDVSGHGLGAGLVMLMLQSSLLTAVLERPGAKPSEILTLVNQALVHNIRGRLGEKNHVTLTLLRYTNDGRVVFAGAHEDMVVVRRRTGAAELVATPGTWLGARKDVGRFFVDSELKLEDGDLLVLYTDGVTEAQSDSGAFFELERLVAALLPVRHKPALLVRDHLLAAVRSFMARQLDDITLMVIRYRAS